MGAAGDPLSRLGESLETAAAEAIASGNLPSPGRGRGGLLAAVAVFAVLAVGAGAFALLRSVGDAGTTRIPEDPKAAFASAVEDTRKVETARFEISVVTDEATNSFVTGAVDHASKRASVEMDLAKMVGGMFGALAGELPRDFDDSGLLGKAHVVVVGDQAYVKGGIFGVLAGRDVGDKWVKVPLRDAAGQFELGDLPADPLEPTKMLDELRNYGATVQRIGTDEVRGERVVHFRATLDVKKAMRAAGDGSESTGDAGTPEEFHELAEGFAESLFGQNLAVDVWVAESDGLLRRVRVELPSFGDAFAGLPGAEKLGEIPRASFQVDFFDLGEPVDIEVPSPDEVVEAEGLQGLPRN